MENSIKIDRRVDGFFIHATAIYDEDADGWDCAVREVNGPWDAYKRNPDETGNNVFATLQDMIDLALVSARQRANLTAQTNRGRPKP